MPGGPNGRGLFSYYAIPHLLKLSRCHHCHTSLHCYTSLLLHIHQPDEANCKSASIFRGYHLGHCGFICIFAKKPTQQVMWESCITRQERGTNTLYKTAVSNCTPTKSQYLYMLVLSAVFVFGSDFNLHVFQCLDPVITAQSFCFFVFSFRFCLFNVPETCSGWKVVQFKAFFSCSVEMCPGWKKKKIMKSKKINLISDQ